MLLTAFVFIRHILLCLFYVLVLTILHNVLDALELITKLRYKNVMALRLIITACFILDVDHFQKSRIVKVYEKVFFK